MKKTIFCLIILSVLNLVGIDQIFCRNLSEDSPFGITGVFYPFGRWDSNRADQVSKMLKQSNTRWIRGTIVRWGLVERYEDAGYDWTGYDNVVKEAQKLGIELIFNIAPYAEWDQGGRGKKKPNNLLQYKKFVYSLVERYDFDGIEDMPGLTSGFHHYEIINEPMALGHFFDGSAEDYFEILKLSYLAAKSASPKTRILIGGLADIDEDMIQGLFRRIRNPDPKMLEYSKTFHTYYDILHTMGVEDYYDILSIHCYKTDIKKQVSYYKKFNKPIWITETARVKEDEKKQGHHIIYNYLEGFAAGAEKIFWFDLMESRQSMNSSLFDREGKPRRTLVLFKFLTDKMGHGKIKSVKQVEQSNSNISLYKIEKVNGKDMWISWSKNDEAQDVSFELDSIADGFSITEADYDLDEKTDHYEFIFNGWYFKPERRSLVVSVSSTPLFIEPVSSQGDNDKTRLVLTVEKIQNMNLGRIKRERKWRN